MAFITTVLLIPYFGWGIYALRHRYRYHEDLPPRVEVATLAGVVGFYIIALSMLRAMPHDNLIFFVFSFLGLMVSGAALYGHVVISVASRLIVDFYTPQGDSPDTPRLGPAQALEKAGDLEGAIQEYLVLARIYPREPAIHTRIAECQLRRENYRASVEAFTRANKLHKTPANALSSVNRIAEIQTRHLHAPEEAARILEDFVRRFPDASESDTVRNRLSESAPTVSQKSTRDSGEALEVMENAPLTSVNNSEEVTTKAPKKKPRSKRKPPVKALKKAVEKSVHEPEKTVEEPVEKISKSPIQNTTPISSGLESLASLEVVETIAEEADEPTKSVEAAPSWGLEALDDADPTPLETEEDIDLKPTISKFSLEAMDPDEHKE